MNAQFAKTTSAPLCLRRAFTLIEMMSCIAILGVLIAIIVPILHRGLEYARESYCMNNLRQIAIGYNQYMSDFATDTPMPASGFFLDDLSPSLPYVKNFDCYICPSTGSLPYTSEAAMGASLGDYLVSAFKTWEDIEFSVSQYNNGHGNSLYGLDPSNPAFKKAGGMSLLSQFENNVVYENYYGNHFRNFRNVVYIKDFHYERLDLNAKNKKKFIQLHLGGVCGRMVDKFW